MYKTFNLAIPKISFTQQDLIDEYSVCSYQKFNATKK